ncbi:uncharacterized protein LOC120826926 isoform X1 [Gasterosteus aculeatus]|uniref:Uncharacterized protein n=1 Tax=Gasterosteus aculeatus aculeatus TaxID=481459 RepID=A0AAQ4P7L0_GASAC|nr:uncharacterized protein si:ch211-13c6.2 isoform X1 [Gasterosteus aculeatus aculeatus]
MDHFETPYVEESTFILCRVCDKSIRGETLYKIHLTTPGHRKKEDVLVASGHPVRLPRIPEFEDILQYLDYMKLDEPIIGLNYLDELPCNDSQTGPKYTCRLCHQTANLLEMVHHVIGRKHRQKYVELKRPDLVTWNKQSLITHGGKTVRARAEIIERQDGRGTPVVMSGKGMEAQLNTSRVPPRQTLNRDQNFLQNPIRRGRPPLRDEYSPPGRGHPGTAPFGQEDAYMSPRDSSMYQQGELQGADRGGRLTDRQGYMEPDDRTEYQEEYFDGSQRRATPEPCGDPRYDPRQEIYPDEAPPVTALHPERDPLKEFYTAEVRRRGRAGPEYPASQPVHPEGDGRRSLDGESGRPRSMNGAGRQGSSEPEAKRRSFPTSMERDQTTDGHLFNFVREYRHEMRELYREEPAGNPRQSRAGSLTSQRQVEASRALSDIPEPFRRFLKGAANDEGYGKRKRKSRFSDATAEEAETTMEMFREYGFPDPTPGRRPAPVYGTQHPDRYREPQSSHRAESHLREDSESTGVFDMLKNIEIENAEEADFLNNKLCDLLKEFKNKKSENALQNSHGRVAVSTNCNSFDPELSPKHQFDTTHREDSDRRRPEELYFREEQGGRGRRPHEQTPEGQLDEYHHPVRRVPVQSNRRHYEEVFGLPSMQHASYPDEPARYPERFEEPRHPLDFSHAPEEFMDSQTSAPPLRMERGHRMDRGLRYSNNLDKITSTLLELVTRK